MSLLKCSLTRSIQGLKQPTTCRASLPLISKASHLANLPLCPLKASTFMLLVGAILARTGLRFVLRLH